MSVVYKEKDYEDIKNSLHNIKDHNEKAETFKAYVNYGGNIERALERGLPLLTDTWINQNKEKLESFRSTKKRIKREYEFDGTYSSVRVLYNMTPKSFKYIRTLFAEPKKIFYIPQEKYFGEVFKTFLHNEATNFIIASLLLSSYQRKNKKYEDLSYLDIEEYVDEEFFNKLYEYRKFIHITGIINFFCFHMNFYSRERFIKEIFQPYFKYFDNSFLKYYEELNKERTELNTVITKYGHESSNITDDFLEKYKDKINYTSITYFNDWGEFKLAHYYVSAEMTTRLIGYMNYDYLIKFCDNTKLHKSLKIDKVVLERIIELGEIKKFIRYNEKIWNEHVLKMICPSLVYYLIDNNIYKKKYIKALQEKKTYYATNERVFRKNDIKLINKILDYYNKKQKTIG